MTYTQLEHAIRAACAVAEDSELIVFGSQAILGGFPDAPPSLRASIEVDVQPLHAPDKVDLIDGSLGELSWFHKTHGFYVHGVSIEAATLPQGWEERTVIVSHPIRTKGNIGHCLESHDLAASKLFAFREKDRQFVRVLLIERMIDPPILSKRLKALPTDQLTRDHRVEWLLQTVSALPGRAT